MLRIFLFLLLWGAASVSHPAAAILVFGDSISAGYGLSQGLGWVTLLQQRLQREGYDYKVINASISGETAVAGSARISGALRQHQPEIVILELGANDGLRGAKIDSIAASLNSMVSESRKQGAKILIVGMQLPPNYGSDYAEKFRSMYATIARSQKIASVPFMFEGFASEPSAFQADGIHPTAAVQIKMLDTIWPRLKPLLNKMKQ